jgi:hypothetical protein
MNEKQLLSVLRSSLGRLVGMDHGFQDHVLEVADSS